jgi:DNA polymerase-1
VSGFCLGRDIHAFTAVRLGYVEKFGPDIGRDRGKTTNHAATYGMSGPTMARRDDIPVREAERGLAAWHETFPGVEPLHEEVRALIHDQGYVEMFDGHRRRFPIANLLLRSGNFRPWEWEGVVREGTNVLCQGGTGVIVKRAMIAIRNRLRAHENKAVRAIRLLNQVHDELCYEAPAEVASEGLSIVKWELEHAAQLRVPIIADGNYGLSWGDAK